MTARVRSYGPTGVTLTVKDVGRLALRFGLPLEDALLIAVNAYGISSGTRTAPGAGHGFGWRVR